MRNWMYWNRCWSICFKPYLTRKVSFTNEALIKVHDTAPIAEQRYHFHSVLLTEHQATSTVGLHWYLLSNTVTHRHFVFHDLSDLPICDLHVLSLQYHINNHFCVYNSNLILKHLAHYPHDGFFLLLLLFLLPFQFSILLFILFKLFH